MSAFARISGGQLRAGEDPRGSAMPHRPQARAGFDPALEGSHDTLGSAALTMLLVLYPALASVVVALAAFLLRGPGAMV